MRPATDSHADLAVPRLRSRRGMAMVLVLILVVVMSLGAAAGFARSSSEYSTTNNMRAQADAWNVAYAGMTGEDYERRNKEYAARGYSLGSLRQFRDCSGIDRYSATWLKE